MPDAAEVVHASLALAVAGWAVTQLSHLRHPGPGRSLWVGMAAIGVGEAIHTRTGFDALAGITGHGPAVALYPCTGLVAAIATLDLLHGLLGTDRRRRTFSACAGVAAILLTAGPLILVPPPDLPMPAPNDPVVYHDSWQVVAYWAGFLSYLGWSLAATSWQVARHSHSLEVGPLRTGMALISSGTAVGLAYVAGHAGLEIAVLADAAWDPHPANSLLDMFTLGPSIALIVTGACWQQIADLRTALRRRLTARTLRRRVEIIRPHWSRLVAVLPEVSPWADDVRAPTGDLDRLHWQQTRMVTEIYDAMRHLLPHVEDEHRALVAKRLTGRGLTDPAELQAASTYVCLRLAVAHRQHTPRPPDTSATPAVPADTADGAALRIAEAVRLLRKPAIRAAIRAVLAEETPR